MSRACNSRACLQQSSISSTHCSMGKRILKVWGYFWSLWYHQKLCTFQKAVGRTLESSHISLRWHRRCCCCFLAASIWERPFLHFAVEASKRSGSKRSPNWKISLMADTLYLLTATIFTNQKNTAREKRLEFTFQLFFCSLHKMGEKKESRGNGDRFYPLLFL